MVVVHGMSCARTVLSTHFPLIGPRIWTTQCARTCKKNMIRVWKVYIKKDVRIVDHDSIDAFSRYDICKRNLLEFCPDYDGYCWSKEPYATIEDVWLFLLMLKNRNILLIDINVISLIFEYYLTGFAAVTTCSVIELQCKCLFHRHCLEERLKTKDFADLCKNHYAGRMPIDVVCKRKVTRAGKLLFTKTISKTQHLYDSIKSLAYGCIKEVGRCKRDVLITHLYCLLGKRVDHKEIANLLSDLVQKKQLVLANDFYFLIKKL